MTRCALVDHRPQTTAPWGSTDVLSIRVLVRPGHACCPAQRAARTVASRREGLCPDRVQHFIEMKLVSANPYCKLSQ
ncbi:hypothetical protein RRG08_005480 [Elysia crispata]|uniref:Uncharacterized protein n=1 Tax=Elysia crispata TaxID=231223 RepID=A0AAE0Y0W3_9GAST|nr:hypothetical protein RRG08_005480 [Elysia crispata]